MTLWTSRDGQKIAIHGNIHLDVKVTNGFVSEFTVTEDAQHVGSFWSQLGELVKDAEAERTDNA